MNIEFSIPEPAGGYDWALFGEEDMSRKMMSEIPVWHQNLLINLPSKERGFTIDPSYRIEQILSDLWLLICGEERNFQRMLTGMVWEESRFCRRYPRDVMPVSELVNMVFPFLAFKAERETLTNELFYFISGEEAYKEDDRSLLEGKELEEDEEIHLLDFKLSAMSMRLGSYALFTAIIWEKYLEEKIQSVHRDVEKLFHYPIQGVVDLFSQNDELSLEDKRTQVTRFLRQQYPMMTRNQGFIWCQENRLDLFNISEDYFRRFWAAGDPEKHQSE